MFRTFISTATLERHLDGSWAVVDCRFDLHNPRWGSDQYRLAHIPGAVYADLTSDLAGRPTGTNGRHPLPPVQDLARTLGRFGIGAGTQVVAYDQDAGMYASRFWWLLRYAGHDAVAVLDGGWSRWLAEGRPTRGGEESRTPVTFDPSPRPELVASIDDVKRISERGEGLLVDARAPERFEGRSEPIDRAAGHIPGALNRFFRRNVEEDGAIRPAEALRHDLAQLLGSHAPAQAVMYCGSGVTACHNLLAMEHAGLTGARLYPGSWSEWSADTSRPVATGPATQQR